MLGVWCGVVGVDVGGLGLGYMRPRSDSIAATFATAYRENMVCCSLKT